MAVYSTLRLLRLEIVLGGGGWNGMEEFVSLGVGSWKLEVEEVERRVRVLGVWLLSDSQVVGMVFL